MTKGVVEGGTVGDKIRPGHATVMGKLRHCAKVCSHRPSLAAWLHLGCRRGKKKAGFVEERENGASRWMGRRWRGNGWRKRDEKGVIKEGRRWWARTVEGRGRQGRERERGGRSASGNGSSCRRHRKWPRNSPVQPLLLPVHSLRPSNHQPWIIGHL